MIETEKRIEIKYDIFSLKKLFLENWIKSQKFLIKKYPSRIIKTIYYDTFDLMAATQNLSGESNRAKYRLRYYIESGVVSDAKFEIKIKKNDTNYKKIVKLDKKIQDINLMSPFSHLSDNYISKSNLINNLTHVKKLYPIIEISYLRSYYDFFNSIVTVDKNITYKIKNKNYYLEKIIDDSYVLELKILISDLKKQKKLQNAIPFRVTRFSKYTKGLAANKKLVYI
jgi:hypothetical protein